MQDIISQSPNLVHEAVLKYDSEIRFGPAYYSLMIDPITFGERCLEVHACGLSRAEQGFIVPQKFEDDKLIYTEEYRGKGVTEEFAIEFLKLSRWEN